ncbi:MAG: hypothetical protein ACHRHE_01420 [Tepidisphaerales bacterium]
MCRCIVCVDPGRAKAPHAPTRLSRRRAMQGGMLMAVSLAAGCQSTTRNNQPKGQPAGTAPITNTDPCATRLHDICGALLLYYVDHHRLPARIEELTEYPDFKDIREFRCPVSGQAYIYNPVGVVSPDQPTRVILYDPVPSHAGMRWGVSFAESHDAAPLVTKVIALPESYFSLNLRVPRS